MFAVKLTETGHRADHVIRGLLNGGKVSLGAFAEVFCFLLEDQVGVDRNRREGVVNVMGYATGHLSQSA